MTLVTFLSDYGLEDEWVGICHAVILARCPEARIVDLGHGIPRHDVRAGALALHDALPYLPVGVHLAVVDPEVGTERRAVALRSGDGRLWVGPDNGVLSLAVARAGGAEEIVDVARSPFRLEPVAATFHGRDVFAPVAARLAAGAPLAEAGDPLEAGELVTLDLPRARVEDGRLVAHVLDVDRFGNVLLDAGHDELAGTGLRLGRSVEVEVDGHASHAPFALTFADLPPGELLVYEDAARRLALAVNRGSAAETLGLARDAEVRLRPAP